MTRAQKVFSIFGISLLGLVLIAYFAIVYIQSSYLKNNILPRAIAYVEANYPVRLKIEDIHLSIWSGLVLKNSEIDFKSPGAEAHLGANEIAIQYSLASFLSSRILVDSVQIKALKVEGKVDLDRLPTKSSTPQSEGNPLQTIGKALENLPKEVEISKIGLEPIQLHFVAQSIGKNIQIDLEKINLNLNLVLNSSSLQMEVQSSIPNSADQKILFTDGKTPFEFGPSLRVNTNLNLLKKPGTKDWNLKTEGKADLDLLLNTEKFLNQKADWTATETNIHLKSAGELSLAKKTFAKSIPALSAALPKDLELKTNLSIEAPTDFKKITTAGKIEIPELLTADLQGGISANLQTINLRGNIDLKPIDEKSSSGQILIPWRLEKTGVKSLSLAADLKAKNFSYAHSLFSIQKFSSDLPIRLDLIWNGGADLQFAYVLNRSPFERVDFANIRPYVADSRTNFRFDQFKIKDYKVGPFFGRVNIRQNLIIVEDYQLSLFDGLATGHLFVDLLPGKRRFGFLGRLTDLNPRAIANKTSKSSSHRLSSRAAAIYDFDRSLAEGRLDITEIGGPQLIDLIDLLDPEYKDSKLNLARSLLKVAHPRYVGVKMSQGFLDLSIDMGGLVSVSDLGADGIPLTPILRMAKEEFLTKISSQ